MYASQFPRYGGSGGTDQMSGSDTVNVGSYVCVCVCVWTFAGPGKTCCKDTLDDDSTFGVPSDMCL